MAQPWAAAVPSGCRTVTHHRVCGLRPAAASRSRAVPASSSPNPAASPGVPDWPSAVASGTVKRSSYAGSNSTYIPADLLGVNELHGGRYWSLAQLTVLLWSHEVGAERRGCCTFLLYRCVALDNQMSSDPGRAQSSEGHNLFVGVEAPSVNCVYQYSRRHGCRQYGQKESNISPC